MAGKVGAAQHRLQATLDRFGRVIDGHDDGQAARFVDAQRNRLVQHDGKRMAQIVAQHDGRELAQDLFAASPPHGRDAIRVLAQRRDACDDGIDILVVHQEPGLVVVDQFGHRAPAIGDDRPARRLRFGDGAAEGFGEMRQSEHDVKLRHRLGWRVGIAGKLQIARQARGLELGDIVVFRADDAEEGVGRHRFRAARDLDEISDALFGDVRTDDAEDDPVLHDIDHVERVDLRDIGRVEAALAAFEQLLRGGGIGNHIVGLVQDAVDDALRIHAHAVAQMFVMVDQLAGMDRRHSPGPARGDQRIDQHDRIAIDQADIALFDDVREILDRGFVRPAILGPLAIGKGEQAAGLGPQQFDIVGIALLGHGDIDVEAQLAQRIEHVDEAAFATEHMRVDFMRAQQDRGRVGNDGNIALLPGRRIKRATPGAKPAVLAMPVLHIMEQRVHPRRAHIRVHFQIAAGAELARRIAPQQRPQPQIMRRGIHTQDLDVGIGAQIPILIEQGRLLDQRHMLSRSGFRRDQFMHFALALPSNQIAASLGLCPMLHPEAGRLRQ